MATIQIRDLVVSAIIGIQSFERDQAQKIIMNISIDYDASRAAYSDDINDAVDYSMVKNAIIRLVESSRFNLIEKMAAEVLKLVMEDEKISASSITIEKPDALPMARSVALTMSACR